MKVIRYEAHNVLKLSHIDFSLEGRHLFIVGGKNDAGKTSALKAFLMAVCGRSGMDYPGVALKEGEDEGWVKVDLYPEAKDAEQLHEERSLTLELRLRRKSDGTVVEKFRIVDSAGYEAPEPRTLLRRLYSMRAFDPLAFERLSSDKQRRMLFQLAGVDIEQQEADYKKLFAKRRELHARLETASRHAEAMPFYPDTPEEEQDFQPLFDRLATAEQLAKSNESKRFAAAKMNGALAQQPLVIQEIQAKIDALLEQKKLEEEKLALLDAEAKVMRQTLDEMQKPEDRKAIQEEITQLQTTNRKVRENLAKRKQESAVQSLLADWRAADDQMRAFRQATARTLEQVKWPVPGMAVSPEGVLLDGLPFEQASKSKRVLTSVRVGMALNPALKILVCEDGNDLDAETLTILDKLLQQNDFQMLVEIVTRSPDDESRCAVIIEDGAQRPGEQSATS